MSGGEARYGARVPPRYPVRSGSTPPPLPPETRTVGQLVAESIRCYAEHWKLALLIGLPAAVLSSAAAGFGRTETLTIVPVVGAVAATSSFVAACCVVWGRPLRSSESMKAFLVGVVVWVPFPVLAAFFVLPGLAWLALLGMAVPAAVVEGLGVSQALRRGLQLARADYVHALGSLATLALLVFITQIAASLLLQNYADNSERVAAFLAGLVLSPLLFFGGALLYGDQVTRVGAGPRSTRRGHVPDGDAAQ